MTIVDFINFSLKVMTLAGLTAGLIFLGLQILIKRLERRDKA